MVQNEKENQYFEIYIVPISYSDLCHLGDSCSIWDYDIVSFPDGSGFDRLQIAAG
ncbi:hypothetical protein TCA2_5139 [Paenibacillus sp. TCA20]|nr:hypothetical protein TCA2_5139 [Paenibacillus sp. TCA20]